MLLENSSQTVLNNIKKFIQSIFTVIRELIPNILDPGKNGLMNCFNGLMNYIDQCRQINFFVNVTGTCTARTDLLKQALTHRKA